MEVLWYYPPSKAPPAQNVFNFSILIFTCGVFYFSAVIFQKISERFAKISQMLSRTFQLYSPFSRVEGGADTDKNIRRFSQKNKNKKDEKGVISKSWTRVLGEKLVVSRKYEGEYQVAKPAVKRPDNIFTLSSLA